MSVAASRPGPVGVSAHAKAAGLNSRARTGTWWAGLRETRECSFGYTFATRQPAGTFAHNGGYRVSCDGCAVTICNETPFDIG